MKKKKRKKNGRSQQKIPWRGDTTTWMPLLILLLVISGLAAWSVIGHVTEGVVLHKSKPYFPSSDPVSFWIFNLPPLLVGGAAALGALFLSLMLILDYRARNQPSP